MTDGGVVVVGVIHVLASVCPIWPPHDAAVRAAVSLAYTSRCEYELQG